jgi:copper homeostasis protein
MREDIALAVEAGVDGVVLGLLTVDGDVDLERTRELVELAKPLEVTFHRAIDKARDMESAFEDVMRTGADRVLTSGGEATAMLGQSRLCAMVKAAAGKIRIMAGGGVRPENVEELMRATGVVEFHAALRSTIPSPVRNQVNGVHLGDPAVDDYALNVVRSEDVRMLRQAMEAALVTLRTGA